MNVTDLRLERVLRQLRAIIRTRKALVKDGVIHSERDVIVDYAEWYASKVFKLKLVKSGVNKTFDATDAHGRTYQIKARRVTSLGQNTSFDFHNYEKFDFLIVVFIDKLTMRPLLAKKIPFSLVKKYWKRNKNRRSLRWNKTIRTILDIQDKT